MHHEPRVFARPGPRNRRAAAALALLFLLGGEAGGQPAPARSPSFGNDPRGLGVNLEGLADWARLKPFVDLMKTSRSWGRAEAPWEHAVAVDPQGWPTQDAGVVIAMQSQDAGDSAGVAYRHLTPGIYPLSFIGKADVRPVASPGVTIENLEYQAATRRSRADVRVAPGASQLMLAFVNTSGGVRDVSLLRPGYAGSGKTFTDEFLTAIRPFGTLRFMDFLATNNNPLRQWSERPLTTSATQASRKGAAYEYVIELANASGKDIWINIPANADDDYIRQLALLLKKRLNPSSAVYVEFSNEVWNSLFSQTRDNEASAVAEALAGDISLTRGTSCTPLAFQKSEGDCNAAWAGFFRVGKRIARISQIFAEVHGKPAINNTIRPVYAAKFAHRSIGEQVLKNIATYRGRPRDLIYGIAGAPYYSLDRALANSPTLTADQIFASFAQSLQKDVLPFFAAGVNVNAVFTKGAPYRGGDWTGVSQKALADFYQIRSLAYEGGPDYQQSNASLAVKLQSNLETRAGEQLEQYLRQWYGCGNDLFVYYSLSSKYSRWGYWGLTNDPSNLNTVKYSRLRDLAGRISSFTTCH